MAKKTSGRARIEEEAERLTEPVAEKNGVRIYDVEYVKEGSEYYLNIYIDKDGGVGILDCEAVSRELSDRLDEADLISDAYTLVVSSPGLGRTLRDISFARNAGKHSALTYIPAIPKPARDMRCHRHSPILSPNPFRANKQAAEKAKKAFRISPNRSVSIWTIRRKPSLN